MFRLGKLTLIILVTLVATLCAATDLPPGSLFAPPGVTSASDPSLGGVVIYEGVHAVSSGGFNGIFRDRVVRNSDGNLIFYDTVYNGLDADFNQVSSSAILLNFVHGSFGGFTVDAGFRPDGIGTVDPDLVARSGGTGDVIAWFYQDGILPGEAGQFTFAKTNAQQFNLNGFAFLNLNDATGAPLSIPLEGIAQPSLATPEPGSLLLLGSGLGVLFKRRKKS